MENKCQLVQNWLKKAEHDIGMAELALQSGQQFTDSICFHCQQFVEKVLKAYLVALDIVFTKTHSLVYLCDLISEKEEVDERIYEISAMLQGYAVGVRYPADDFEPNISDAKEAYNATIEVRNTYYPKIDKILENQNER